MGGRMEYRNLKTFLRVAELQNFTKAANELGYAQSTVTFHIHALEEELGILLFERIGKRVSLTKAGEYLVRYANEMERIIAEMEQLNGTVSQVSGSLRVGVVESILVTFMSDLLTEYCRRFPDVTVEVVTGSTTMLMNLLRSNDVDLIIIMGNRIVDYDFFRVMIREEGISFVASADHPLAGETDISFRTILECPLILPEKDSLYRRSIEPIASQYDSILVPKLQINNTAMIIELLKKGMGVSYLPDYMIESSIKDGSLAKLDVNYEVGKYYIQIFHHRNKWVSAQMEEFITIAEEMIK